VRYCITGGLPLSSPFAESPSREAKEALRKSLENPDFLCESPQLEDLPGVREMLSRCFLANGSLRPTVPEIGRVIMDAFVDQTHGSHNVAGGTSPDDTKHLLQAKEGAMTKIGRARSKLQERKPPEKNDYLSKADWLAFLQASDLEVDAVAEYIVGASAWLNLVKAADCESQFDASDNGKPYLYDVSPPALCFPQLTPIIVSRARFALSHLTTAAEAGFLDGDWELAQVHQYFARSYEQSNQQKRELLKTSG
jgi:hypothetical protein